MSIGFWKYDPVTGQTSEVAIDDSLTPATTIGTPDKSVYVAGGNVISSMTGGTLTTLGRAGESTFRVFGNGAIDVNSPISLRSLNTPMLQPDRSVRTYVQKELSFDVTLLVLGNVMEPVHIEGVATAPVGHQVLAHVMDNGITEFITTDRGFSSTREVQATYGFGPTYRLATPTEIAERAVGGYLARNMPDALREMLRNQGVDQQTLDSTDNYDLASFFDIGSITNMQAYSRTWLFPGPIR